MEAEVTSFKHSGLAESLPSLRGPWSVVITLYLDPVDPGKGAVRRFSSYDSVTGKQGPERDTYWEALRDIPREHREAAAEPH